MIIGFSGLPGAGKTSLSTALAKSLGIPRVGFGSYVRSVAIEKNLPIDRASLQNLGQHLIEDNISQFCKNVLKKGDVLTSEVFILDGIRHNSVLSHIKLNHSVFLVYVEVSSETLMHRLTSRGEPELLDAIQSEPTEMEVESVLRSQADIIVSGEYSIENQISKIKSAISSFD